MRFHPRRTRPGKNSRPAFAGLVVGLVLLLVPLAVPAGAQAGVSRTSTVSPGDDLKAAMEGLRPGDTLLLAPGTYRTGYLRPRLAPGRADARITVKAQQWSAPPTIVGGLELASADYWTLHRLRVQGAAARAPGLHMRGGTGWRVSASEFWGARATQAFANVAIDGGNGYPRSFSFAENCVHDAATSTRVKTDHNMYVKFHGAGASGGVISHNMIFGHPNGAGIKLGDGGAVGAPGPWGVKVSNNTIVNGGRQILMSHDVRGNTVVGNLLGGSSEPFTSSDRRTTGIYALMVGGSGNAVAHNYVFDADMALRDPYGKLGVGPDVAVRPRPRMDRPNSCGMSPTTWQARYYGRTSGGNYLSW